jgi:hypothetical protein
MQNAEEINMTDNEIKGKLGGLRMLSALRWCAGYIKAQDENNSHAELLEKMADNLQEDIIEEIEHEKK